MPGNFNAAGALISPLALYYRRKKGKLGAAEPYLFLLVLVMMVWSVGAACEGTPPATQPPTETPPPTGTLPPSPDPGTGPGTGGTPTPTPTEPPQCPGPNCPSTPMLTSGYYIPTESQAKKVDGNFMDAIPVDSSNYANQLYLTRYELKGTSNEYTNWQAGNEPPLKVYDGLIYDYNFTCLQGSAKLDLSANGHYISCNTDYVWNGYISYNQNPNRAQLPIRYRWADEAKIKSLTAFHTAAVCPGSPLEGKTIQIIGLPDGPNSAMEKLRNIADPNPEAIFTVTDTGGKLCTENKVDIYTGEGEDAFEYSKLFWDKRVQIVER